MLLIIFPLILYSTSVYPEFAIAVIPPYFVTSHAFSSVVLTGIYASGFFLANLLLHTVTLFDNAPCTSSVFLVIVTVFLLIVLRTCCFVTPLSAIHAVSPFLITLYLNILSMLYLYCTSSGFFSAFFIKLIGLLVNLV